LNITVKSKSVDLGINRKINKNILKTLMRFDIIYYIKKNNEVMKWQRIQLPEIPKIFTEFLNGFIPIDILKGLKPEAVEDISPRFIPLFSDNKDSDTVMKINLGSDNDPLYIVSIVEHESHINYTSSVKMFIYMAYVLHDYIKENDKLYKEEINQFGSTKRKLSTTVDFKLPPILPVVFYDGATQWTSSMNLLDRTYMGDIFEKYIPKFEYELVDLNQHSREELIKYGNALSLILLIDKIRWVEDMEWSASVPQDYLDKLAKNIPEPLLPLISDCVKVFLEHIEAPKEEIERISEKIYSRRMNEMFQMVDGYSVKKTREQARIEGKEEARAEANEKAYKEKLEIAKKLFLKGFTIKEISEIVNLSEEKIQKALD
jgi:predicted transposase/invertase (TIGR01784 family)